MSGAATAPGSWHGYRIYWRETTAHKGTHSRFIPKDVTDFTLEGMVLDNYFFGVASVGKDGNERSVSFPVGLIRRGE